MRYSLTAVTLLLVAIPATPAPQLRQQAWYFPTVAGTSWAHQELDFADRPGAKYSLETVDQEGDLVRVRIGTDFLGMHFRCEELLISAEEIIDISRGRSQPVWLLRGPIQPGTKWVGEEYYMPNPLKRGSYLVNTTRSIRAIEWIEVPAGRFRAVRVDSVLRYEGNDVRKSCWYAPGVGLVKDDDGRHVNVLQAFKFGSR